MGTRFLHAGQTHERFSLLFKLCLISECPRSPDHMERFACPRPDRRGRFRCIDDRALCDGFYDCPDKEDENPDHCLFYKTVETNIY